MLRILFSCFLLAGALFSTGAAADDDLHMCIHENGDVAIEACNRAINSGRYSGVHLSEAYLNRAAEWATKKDYDRAISDASTAIKLFPEGTLAYTNRGLAYQRKGDLTRALADYNVALSHDRENTRAYINRATVREAQGNIKGAIADLKRALASKPENGKFVDVESDFERARKHLAKTYNNLCWKRAIDGLDLSKAVSDCNESLRLLPNDANTLDSRGFTYLKLGQFDNSIVDYDAALKLNPKIAASLYGRGMAKQKKGDLAGAEADMAAAKVIDAKIVETFSGYGVK